MVGDSRKSWLIVTITVTVNATYQLFPTPLQPFGSCFSHFSAPPNWGKLAHWNWTLANRLVDRFCRTSSSEVIWTQPGNRSVRDPVVQSWTVTLSLSTLSHGCSVDGDAKKVNKFHYMSLAMINIVLINWAKSVEQGWLICLSPTPMSFFLGLRFYWLKASLLLRSTLVRSCRNSRRHTLTTSDGIPGNKPESLRLFGFSCSLKNLVRKLWGELWDLPNARWPLRSCRYPTDESN